MTEKEKDQKEEVSEEQKEKQRFNLMLKHAKQYDPEQKNLKPGIYKTQAQVLFRVIDNHLLTGIDVLGDNSEDVVKPGIYATKVPKIPYPVLDEIITFFRYVFTEYGNAEAIVLLWYNPETKKWDIEVPKQEVASASLDYDRKEEEIEQRRNKGFKLIGTIHSHGSMGAFHSGTDDHDEFGFDGLHITIGKVMMQPQFSCRYIMKDWYKMMEPKEVFERLPEQEVYPTQWKDRVHKKTYGQKKNKKTVVNKLFDGEEEFDDDDRDDSDPFGTWYDNELKKKKQWVYDNDTLVS